MSEILYSWKIPNKKNRSSTWYLVALSIIIGLVIWGFLTKMYGMSLIVLLASGVLYFIENNSEDEIEIYINNNGIKIGNSFYDFGKISSYTIIYSGENPIFLRLNLSNKGFQKIDLMINPPIAGDIKNVLSNFIEENPKEELSFLDRLINILKL